jgi:NTP pyrophosphatase (non-canonical NTP hydrolase)
MTTPVTFPEYLGPKPRLPANPLIAIDEICEHALAIAGLDLCAAADEWCRTFGLDTRSVLEALMACPAAADWIAARDAHPDTHLASAETWRALRVAPHPNPLLGIEQLRGRVLHYQVGLPNNASRKEIVEHLAAIQDLIDAVHFALRQHADSLKWQSELAEYERAQHAPEQNARDRKTFATLVEAIVARQREWDANGRLTALYHALELGGEIGELLNIVKKQERLRLGLPGSTATDEQLREELGDVLTCVLLLANALGIDVEAEARKKFNARSEQLGFATRVEV